MAVGGSGFVGDRLQGIDKCKKAFCYEYELLFHSTGKFEIIPGEAADVLGHYACAGFSPDQTLAEAETAIQFFLDQYGLNFTAATDDQRLGIGPVPPVLAAGANVVFTPFRLDTDETFRLVSASSRYNFDFINEPIKDAGWIATFLEDYVSTGTYNYTVPTGSVAGFGSYIIDPCPKWGRFCPTFLKRRYARPIFIRYWTRTYLQVGGPLPPTEQALLVNLGTYSDQFGGEGLARGSVFMTSDPDRVDLRIVVTFPPFRDDK